MDGVRDASGLNADFEGTKDDKEHAGGEVGEESGPGSADRDASGGDESGESCCLDTEVTEDGVLTAQRAAGNIGGQTDKPTAGKPKHDGAKDLEGDS